MKYLAALIFLLCAVPVAQAQELVADTVTVVRAQVLEVLVQDTRVIPGTDTSTDYQTIRVEVLEGEDTGLVLTLENDYIQLKEGEVFYARHEVNTLDGTNRYSVLSPYRLPIIVFFLLLFLACLAIFGGLQGIRGLIALVLSIGLIVYALLPGILAGIPPFIISVGVAGVIIIIGSYITHGINRTTSVAVVGMLVTVAITGLLAMRRCIWVDYQALAPRRRPTLTLIHAAR